MRKFLLLSSLFVVNIFTVKAQVWHIMPTQQERDYKAANPKPVPPSTKKTTGVWTMPAGARLVAEFEESQAVAIGWPYDFSGIDVDPASDYANIWAEMAKAIQVECPVWIRVDAPADSIAVKQFMSNKGMPLTNYKFHISVCDAFWIRDFGPLGFYHGANDDLGFVDMNYYPGRDLDDVYPEFLAGQLGIINVRTNVYAEGGNFITDGFHKSFYSDRIHDINTGLYGPNPLHINWTLQQTTDSLKYAWASPDINVSAELECDGGTGHNDMYMKMTDENTFIIMEYPSVVTAQDKNIISNEINVISGMNSTYGRKYRVFKYPMPTRNNGTYSTSCGQIDNDARTFVNGLTVNKTYLMPSFSNATSGNKSGDTTAINLCKKLMPGYKIVPIDSRALTVLGGAIHCVSMQIPADNPVTFWHPPIIDLQPLQNTFHIVSKITNRSGIASAICKWRKKGATAWNTVNLTDSSGYHIGDITGSFVMTDEVEYYLSATTNNGKTMTKPLAAADGGYYLFLFEYPISVNAMDPTRNFVLNPLPNPTTGEFFVPVSFETVRHIQAYVTDIFGKKISAVDFGTRAEGMHKLDFNLSNMPAGMYFVQVMADGQIVDTKKVMKQ